MPAMEPPFILDIVLCLPPYLSARDPLHVESQPSCQGSEKQSGEPGFSASNPELSHRKKPTPQP